MNQNLRKRLLRNALTAAVTGTNLFIVADAAARPPAAPDAQSCSANERRFGTANGSTVVMTWNVGDRTLRSSQLIDPKGQVTALPDGDYVLHTGSKIVKRGARVAFASANGAMYCPPNTATDPFCKFEKEEGSPLVNHEASARLADGTPIVYSIRNDVTSVFLASGALLPDGTYTLFSTETFTVVRGVVTSGSNGVFVCSPLHR
jgi:hypothetical protein